MFGDFVKHLVHSLDGHRRPVCAKYSRIILDLTWLLSSIAHVDRQGCADCRKLCTLTPKNFSPSRLSLRSIAAVMLFAASCILSSPTGICVTRSLNQMGRNTSEQKR